MHIQIVNIKSEIKPKYQKTHYCIGILQPKSSEQPND
jgi:hypothetical protein